MKGILNIAIAVAEPVLGQTLSVDRELDGRVKATVWAYSQEGVPQVVWQRVREDVEEAVQDAHLWDSLLHNQGFTGMVTRRGTACRDGEVQHGEHVIVIPDALSLGELCEMWLADDRPGEDAAMEVDPQPVATPEAIYQLLAGGHFYKPLRAVRLAIEGASPNAVTCMRAVRLAIEGASPNAVTCMRDDELIVIDWRDAGMVCQVFGMGFWWSVDLQAGTVTPGGAL